MPTTPFLLACIAFGRHVEDAHVFRIGHPLAQHILETAASKDLPEAEIVFDYSGQRLKISILEPLVETSGYLSLARLSVESFEEEDHLIFAAITNEVCSSTENRPSDFSRYREYVTSLAARFPVVIGCKT